MTLHSLFDHRNLGGGYLHQGFFYAQKIGDENRTGSMKLCSFGRLTSSKRKRKQCDRIRGKLNWDFPGMNSDVIFGVPSIDMCQKQMQIYILLLTKEIHITAAERLLLSCNTNTEFSQTFVRNLTTKIEKCAIPCHVIFVFQLTVLRTRQYMYDFYRYGRLISSSHL